MYLLGNTDSCYFIDDEPERLRVLIDREILGEDRERALGFSEIPGRRADVLERLIGHDFGLGLMELVCVGFRFYVD